MKPVYFEEFCGNKTVKIKIPHSQVIVNAKTGNPISIVSKEYRLVTNEEAIEFGKKCFKELFKTVNTDDLEIFNIIVPRTRSFCHIDLIHKNYEVNIGKQEIYLPYIRVTNSYNRTRALSFDLGFCRKMCDNGVIFEQESIKFRFSHTKKIIGREIVFDIKVGRLKALENKFLNYINKLSEYEIELKYIPSMVCKALNIRFDVENENAMKKQKAIEKLNRFKQQIAALINRYIPIHGSNAYTVFNIITDYSSNPGNGGRIGRLNINGLQKRSGAWVEDFLSSIKDGTFQIDKYIGDFSKVFENDKQLQLEL